MSDKSLQSTFRREAIEAQRTRRMGAVSLYTSPAMWAGFLAAAVILGIVIFAGLSIKMGDQSLGAYLLSKVSG